MRPRKKEILCDGDKMGKGIRVKRVYLLLLVIAALTLAAGIFAEIKTLRSYYEMEQKTEAYIESVQQAVLLQNGSDYLTEQVRSFVITGDLQYVDNFFTEATVTRRRDKALETLSGYFEGREAYTLLKEALATSNELMKREYEAMVLGLQAEGVDPDSWKEELRGVKLPEETAGWTSEEKRERSRELVFDSIYQDYKARIYGKVSACTDMLTGEMRSEQQHSSDILLSALRNQVILISLLLCIVILSVILTYTLVMRPLESAVKSIEKHSRMPVEGAYELRYLAEVYNRMAEDTARSHDKLNYEASHDGLTGLYNRGAFDRLREDCRRENHALMLLDLDYFKTINDQYGHAVGDRALKKVAGVLTNLFRREDAVCRIGGDEFAVLMVRADRNLTELVRRKVESANRTLGTGGEGLPAMSLSVGVAFAEPDEEPGAVYRRADAALYHVKESGRQGVAFDNEITDDEGKRVPC